MMIEHTRAFSMPTSCESGITSLGSIDQYAVAPITRGGDPIHK